MAHRRLAHGAACLLVPALAAVCLPGAAQNAPTGNVFNPNISVIGNALGIVGHNPVDNQPSLQLRESEIGLQAIVDPYARARATSASRRGTSRSSRCPAISS
jgi:hypothetical protein